MVTASTWWFKDKPIKKLIALAKLQTQENEENYPESVRKAVQDCAEKKRLEVRKVLPGHLLSFVLDMAACRHRSFIGKNLDLTSKRNFVYLFPVSGFTVQLNFNGTIKVINLFCQEVRERHNAANIQSWIKDGQNQYKIVDQQIIALAIDSARNMTKAVDNFIAEILSAEQINLRDNDEISKVNLPIPIPLKLRLMMNQQHRLRQDLLFGCTAWLKYFS